MRIFIAGIDGYLGWSLALHLKARGHNVGGLDSGIRREWVKKVGSDSGIPIAKWKERRAAIDLAMFSGDMRNYGHLGALLKFFKPDAVVHLAENPSAPYSMLGPGEAAEVQQNNIIGSLNLLWAMKETCPHAHLLKLGCYDDQTEVLTDRGWVLFSKLQFTDSVCCLDANTGKMEYYHSEHIVRYPHKGKMLEVRNGRMDFCVTPNHRVVVVENGEVCIKRADEIREETIEVPRIGLWDGVEQDTFTLPAVTMKTAYGHRKHLPPLDVPMDAFLAFLGQWLSDGGVKARDSQRVTYWTARKPRKLEAFDAAIKDLSCHFSNRVTKDGMVWRETSCPQLGYFLEQLGGCHEKRIPRQLLLLSSRQLGILLDACIEGDGHRQGEGQTDYFCSTSMDLLDGVQEVALKCGRPATLCTNERTDGKVDYYLSIGNRPTEKITAAKRNWVDYDGDVFCCTVPTGIIMTRRNGRVCWSGNTMGEYGTPTYPIPEGFFTEGAELRCGQEIFPLKGIWFPRQPGSFYHLTKVHDSHNIAFACRMWGLCSTDIMQGVVYGTYLPQMGTDPVLRTRFDFDEIFGTCVNRFCAQAVIGHPLTIYGKGGQTRGYLPLQDSMQCFTLALEHPPKAGEYRVFNQFETLYSVERLAEEVNAAYVRVAGEPAEIRHFENPRIEAERHFYRPEHRHLLDLGYVPTADMPGVLDRMIKDLIPHRERLEKYREHIAPRTRWDTHHRKSEIVDA